MLISNKFYWLIFSTEGNYWHMCYIDTNSHTSPTLLFILCYSAVNRSCFLPIPCIHLSDFYFCRHLLGIRHWHFGWWMLKCTPTWVFWPLLLQLLIVEYSFIKWFDSLLMPLVEKAISTLWVSMNWTHNPICVLNDT